ncbi:MAG: branched-chain amino acid aminotransferase [Pseudomonadota bacterium]|nr:MAG: branched chain amino acid aminotransferase [Pseudomonadota bacterium]
MTQFGIELRPKKQPLSAEQRQELLKDPGFGRVFTEHMVTLRYRHGQGWGQGVLEPYAPLTLDPAASVLHYGQAVFEGFKAYRQADGRIATFRPDANARRFNASARRLAMPELPEELFIHMSDALIAQDHEWVPSEPGQSLYIRPLMIATEAALGVRPAKEYLFLVFGSPAGSYFPQGVKPLSVWLSKEYVRAAPGGTGEAKCAGNYAASLIAQQQAMDQGCQQVVWLDAKERRFVEEMGGMNMFFVYRDGGRVRLVTPKLTGTLLPGITRDSILKLAPDMGYTAEEKLVSVEDWGRDLESGALTEVFACGTAAVVTPIGTVRFEGGSWTINGGESGPVALAIRERLLAIQHGTAKDAYGWMHPVPVRG